MSEQKQNFGYVNDNDESLKSKQGGKFGLNQAYITKFEYNPNAGKDGAEADAIDVHVQVGDREYRSRIYAITGSLYKGKVLIEPDEEGYIAVYNTEMKQRNAVGVHIAKALGVTEKVLEEAFKTAPKDFAEWAQVITSLPSDDSKTKPIDVFLEYQWTIQDGQDRTFLQLPSNMKGGRFLCSSIAPKGEWTEHKVKGDLVYKDASGKEHPFTRTGNYMKSPKANQQIEGEEHIHESASTDTTAKKGAW